MRERIDLKTAKTAKTAKAAKRGWGVCLAMLAALAAHATKLAVYRESPDYEVVGVVEPDAGLRKRAETRPPTAGSSG